MYKQNPLILSLGFVSLLCLNFKDMNEDTQEIFIPIKGYEGLYEISNLGRVKSIGRKIVRIRKGILYSSHTKDIICRHSKDTRGYPQIIVTKDGERKSFKVHRLVALSFLENSENKREINHINGIKDDNRLENLEWCTSKYNTQHAFKIGIKKPLTSEQHGSSIKVINTVTGKSYPCIAKAAKDIGISFSLLSRRLKEGTANEKYNISYA